MSQPRSKVLLACVACCGAVAMTAPPAQAAATPTWSVQNKPVLGEDNVVVGPVSDGTRLWTIELPPNRQALLRARSIRTGKLVRSVRVAVPLSPGATVLGDTDGNALPQQLVVGDRAAAVTGTWCSRDVEDERGGGSTCEDARTFYARFSPRTGRVGHAKLTTARRELVAGNRPTELVRRPGRPSVLRDIVTRRTILTVPRSAVEVQGAGRFIAWKLGRDAVDGQWSTMRVLDRDTGRERYTLRASHLAKVVGPGTGEDEPWANEANLTSSGSVDLHVYYAARRVHPVTVDDRGRIRRLTATFRYVNEFTSAIRGDRVLVNTNPNHGDPKGPCFRTTSWITDRTGRVGNTFRSVPATGRLELSNDPIFVSPTAILWNEQRQGSGDVYPTRNRIVPDVHTLPLTRAERPNC